MFYSSFGVLSIKNPVARLIILDYNIGSNSINLNNISNKKISASILPTISNHLSSMKIKNILQYKRKTISVYESHIIELNST